MYSNSNTSVAEYSKPNIPTNPSPIASQPDSITALWPVPNYTGDEVAGDFSEAACIIYLLHAS